MIPHLQAPLSFWTTRRLSRASLDRQDFERRQARAIARWLRRSVPKVDAFDTKPTCLTDLPVMDKTRLMANFAAYNVPGITAEQVRAAMADDYRIGHHTVGASTGTSGNRGLFVINDAERFRWLGTILAKTMADLLWHRQRVAIVLPQDTGLYDSANQFRQIQLKFFNLKEGPSAWRQALETFDPTVIVAPPKVLRHLADAAYRLRPLRVFSAAETLDPIDRPVIEGAFDVQLEQIYMATEGLLGVTCRHGVLHLAEDSVHFEFETVEYADQSAGKGALVSPLISTFRRDTQILARYRMNDLLRLAAGPCSCGSPLRAVSEVVGRMDDCFQLHGQNGPEIVTPDILRNVVLDADTRIKDFRLVQTGATEIMLTLPTELAAEVGQAAQAGLQTLLASRGLQSHVSVQHRALPLDVSRKLRRVERRWSKGAAM